MSDHAAYTKDESVWISFTGEVPRAGEIISIMGKDFKVNNVKWFIFNGDKPLDARVLISEVNEATSDNADDFKKENELLRSALKFYADMKYDRNTMQWMSPGPDKAMNALSYKSTDNEKSIT